MFEADNRNILHKEAIHLVLSTLQGSVDVDSLGGSSSNFDISWNGNKIVVKVAKRLQKSNQKKPKWFYAITEKDRSTADFFILFAIDKNWLEAVFVIPRKFLPKTYITISNLSGTMRYSYFRVALQDLAGKIENIKKELPKLSRISAQAKTVLED